MYLRLLNKIDPNSKFDNKKKNLSSFDFFSLTRSSVSCAARRHQHRSTRSAPIWGFGSDWPPDLGRTHALFTAFCCFLLAFDPKSWISSFLVLFALVCASLVCLFSCLFGGSILPARGSSCSWRCCRGSLLPWLRCRHCLPRLRRKMCLQLCHNPPATFTIDTRTCFRPFPIFSALS